MTCEREQVVVVGAGPVLELCIAALTGPTVDARSVIVDRVPGSGHDLRRLAEYPPDRWRAFAAVGNGLLNLLRLGLMSELRGAGYRLVRIVSPSASVPRDWQPGENTYVGDRTVIGPGVTVRHNAFIDAGAIIGPGVTIGHSVWIGAGVILGAGASVGDGTIIAEGSILRDGIRIGRQCELGIARTYRADVVDRTFYGDQFEGGVRIHSRERT